MIEPKLTKSKFKLACECPTKLYYLDKSQYANQLMDNSFLKALAEGGYQVEALARCYFPEGKFVTSENNESSVAATGKYLNEDSITLFEAAVEYQNYLIRTDILIKHNNNLKLIEIKAKSIGSGDTFEKRDGSINSKWKPYIADVAFQKWVLQHAYPNLHISSYLMLVDKDSHCPTNGLNSKFLLTRNDMGRLIVKIMQPLTHEDLSIRLLKEINVDHLIDKIWSECDLNGLSFEKRFENFSQQYFRSLKPPPILTKECATCQFKTIYTESPQYLSGFKECWRELLTYNENDFLEPTIFELWFGDKDKCIQKGLIKLCDFTEEDLSIKEDEKPGLSRSQRQWLQIEKVKKNDNTIWIDATNLRDEMQSWVYPLHFIDFETAMLPIPFKKGAKPYQGIAFQFSHHIMDQEGRVSHVGEYLNTNPGTDPTIEFIRALKKELENDAGTIFRYSSHENTYLNTILIQLTELIDPPPDLNDLIIFIKSITKSSSDSKEKRIGERCMVDLLDLVIRNYYDPLTHGSNSIKKVLPAILTRSKFLQQKYGKPTYGNEVMISKNFINQQWIVFENDVIKDPYSLLDPINKEAPDEKIEFLFTDDHLKEGGAATIAYAKLQFTQMSDFERTELRQGLLKYCELDTLAMVMIVEGWKDLLRGKSALVYQHDHQ